MLANYLKIAWRNIIRHRWFAVINILGLSLGMTCCLFILLWVRDERAVDNFHVHGDRLYTVYTKSGGTGGYNTPIKYSQGPVLPLFALDGAKDVIPGIVHTTYYATAYELPWGHAETFQVRDKLVKLEGSRADSDFFKMFSYPLLEGDAAGALRDPDDIAISRKMAVIFWGSPAAAIGQTIRVENRFDFKVSAVFEDLPGQSSMHFDYLTTWASLRQYFGLASGNFQTLIELAPGADPAAVTAGLNRIIRERFAGNGGDKVELGLQRYGDAYLHSVFVDGRPRDGRIEYVRLFSGIALFILLIACINFMNLATARSVRRAKEVGLRKVVGAERWSLIGQFFGESVIFALLALLLSLVLVQVFLPAFNRFTDKAIVFPWTDGRLWCWLTGIWLVTGVVAGSYPALYLSSLRPVRVLKGVFRFTAGATWFRKSLTVFQFVLSIVLLIATIVVVRQTEYAEHTDLGYNRENLVYIRIEGNLSRRDKYLLFKQEALRQPGIAMVDRSSETPHAMNFVALPGAITWDGMTKDQYIGVKPASVGFDFVKLMHLQVVRGRDFSIDNPSDSTDAFLVNEEAARQMGMTNPIGKAVSAWAKHGHIIGVIKDYHTQSLRDPILPVLLDVKEGEDFGVIIARTQPGRTREALAGLKKVYRAINPQYPFACQFVDEEYDKLYTSEILVTRLSILFAVLAILISCMGLLGLVMFSAEQRTKEIGVRKVLGASVGQIVALFSRDSLQLVAVAFVVAVPLGWLAMHAWLQQFAYRVSLSWWIFALAGAASLTLALATMGYQAIRAAVANPVKSLRTE